MYVELALVEQQFLGLYDDVIVYPCMGIYACQVFYCRGEVFGRDVLFFGIEFYLATFGIVFHYILMKTVEHLFVHRRLVLGYAVLLTILAQHEEEGLKHVAEHEFAMLCRRGAYALDDAEDIVYEEELLVGERYVLTIQIMVEVTINGREAPLEFLLKSRGYDDEHGVVVGRGLSGAQYVVGCKNGNVVLVEDDFACVTLCLSPSFQVEADGHKRGGERLVV